MALITDIQKLEPGAEIRLFEIDGTEYGADYLRFHGQAIPHTPEELILYEHSEDELPAKSIWWQGEEYAAWPVQFEGVSSSSDGTAARPTFAAGNVNRRITALCLAFEDLAKFQLTVRETTAKYLDAVNFPDGNPSADPTQEALDIWYIDQKTVEDDTVVVWELSSPGEIDNHGVPGRQMTTFCDWAMRGGYRGPDCQYVGAAMFDDEDNPTDDPAKDQCKGCLSSCKLRFGEFNELSFGGFPAVSLIARS